MKTSPFLNKEKLTLKPNAKIIQKRKLQSNIPHEHKCKNSTKPFVKSNPEGKDIMIKCSLSQKYKVDITFKNKSI